MTIEFGIQHAAGDPNWGPGILAPVAVAGFARAAEASGYGAIAFTDHPAPSTKPEALRHHAIAWPPLTRNTLPVAYFAASESR